jgi:hypothetical protein
MTTTTKLATALLAGALALAASLRASRRDTPETPHAAQSPAPSGCEEWKEALARLTASQKDAMRRDGAILTQSQTQGYLLLSEDLVPDCELRGRMSSYLDNVLFVLHDSEDERKFAAAHSKEIVGVLRRLWPSLGDSQALLGSIADPDAKYVLLADPALKESDIAPLVSDILDAENIDNAIGRIIFHRPLAGEKPALLRLLKDNDDPPTEIMVLLIFNKMGDPSAMPKLKRLARSPLLNEVERKYATAIVAKAARGEEIKFSDVEDLEYENPRPLAYGTRANVKSSPGPR